MKAVGILFVLLLINSNITKPTSTILLHFDGEPPDIPQTHDGPNGGEDELEVIC